LLAVVDPLDLDLDQHVAGLGFRALAKGFAHVQIAPQQVGSRNRQRDQVSPIDGDPGAFLGHRTRAALFHPPPHARVPQSQSLQGRGLAGVVRPDEHDPLTELDLDLVEELEIANDELGQHGGSALNLPSMPISSRLRAVTAR
jgi:hypothetical protein